MEEKFGNQYFEKQGTEHSSRPPYQHEPEPSRDFDSDEENSSSPSDRIGSTKKISVGNKDEYQGGDAAGDSTAKKPRRSTSRNPSNKRSA